MGKLFDEITTYRNFNEWKDFFDWLFDDTKFDGWSRDKKGALTKAIKRISGFPTADRYRTGSAVGLTFSKNYRKTIIIFQNGGSESEELIRHIRNAVAHGIAEIKNYSGILYFKANDYGKSSRRNNCTMQTAFLLIPVDMLLEMYKTYNCISKTRR